MAKKSENTKTKRKTTVQETQQRKLKSDQSFKKKESDNAPFIFLLNGQSLQMCQQH